MRKRKAALVGGGRIADLHVGGYRDNAWAELHAVCDIRPEVARRRAAEWGCPVFTSSFSEILESDEIDIVEVITPHHLHCEMVVAAAAAGKHVSVQKPMALTLAECDRMIDACRQAGVKLRVFENFVFYPPYVRAKELLAEGAIGEPLTLRLRIGAGAGGWPVPLRTWLWRLREGRCGFGPTLFDDGYHKFSVAWDFFGPVQEVAALIDYSLAFVDAPAAVVWRHAGGCLGSIDATFSPNLTIASKYYSADERVEITGTEGVLYLSTCSAQLLPGEPALTLVRNGQAHSFTDLRSDWQASFVDCTRHFSRAVALDEEPRLTGARGREVVRFAIGAYEAARRGGGPVELEEISS
ncbi:MAG: Gfo/Idh/MocA family oxidoreductase [Candidatus Schekmanbacteria bacterium]|nr:Gfo/Idh/MocA family oxidoreductase [Candidatus Schekmanbacteria bacterium]